MEEASVVLVHINNIELRVELDFPAVAELHLIGITVFLQCKDFGIRIAVVDKFQNGLRNNSGRDLRLAALDVGPFAFFVKLDLVTAGEQQFIGSVEEFGVFFGKSHFFGRKVLFHKPLGGCRKLFESDGFVVTG